MSGPLAYHFGDAGDGVGGGGDALGGHAGVVDYGGHFVGAVFGFFGDDDQVAGGLGEVGGGIVGDGGDVGGGLVEVFGGFGGVLGGVAEGAV